MKLPGCLKQLGEEDFKSLVLIGSNGAGKTRLSIWIEMNNKNVHRISAQKSLKFPECVSTIKVDSARENLLLGNGLRIIGDDIRAKMSTRWKNSPQNHELKDVESLLVYLFSDLSEKAIEEYEEKYFGEEYNSNNTALFLKLKSAWENIFPTKKLKLAPGYAYILDGDEKYSYTELSDGERGVLYFIGESLAVPNNGTMIIDEPENHLNKAILERTWTTIENLRPDCKFIYITHDLEFAKSRECTRKIWVKKYVNTNEWDLEILDENNEFSEELIISVLGSRKNTLFIEGKDSKSYDKRLYSKLFPDYSIIAVDSCDKVKEITKTFNTMNNLHGINAKGIIDRDRRNENEVEKNKASGIYSPSVAEVENLFLIPDVVKIVCRKNNIIDTDTIIDELKEDIINYLRDNKKEQIKSFVKNEFNNSIIKKLNIKDNTLEEYKSRLSDIINLEKLLDIERNYEQEIDNILNNKDVNNALKIINNKGLIVKTHILQAEILGMTKNGYFNSVLRLISSEDEEGSEIKKIMKEYIDIDHNEKSM